ncbi:MAG: TVP38/TMEM64 family protein [Agathobacter sp.]|nr:TVP38/TMEM64 family protein [Agathobacter sp.]
MKKYRYLILLLSIVVMAGLTLALWKPLISFIENPDSLALWIESAGIWGPIVFMLLNTVQVLLAIIPGGPFEVAAGALFGPFAGTLLCDIAMTTGGMITFFFVRKFGMKFIELFVDKKEIESVKFLHSNEKYTTLLFLFFLLPGTPKDLMCYVVGLTDIKWTTWLLINFVGRFPAILLSALGGSALGEQKYGIFIAAFVVIIILYFLGTFLYKKFNHNHHENA